MSERSVESRRRRACAARARYARRNTRTPLRQPIWQRRSLGQTLIMFALVLVTLVSLLGLAIDSVRLYDLYARMQRAAEAGALAGVLYVPNYYSVADTQADNKSAISRALDEVYKNGFGVAPPHAAVVSDCTPNPPNPAVQMVCSRCPAVLTTIEIAVCPVVNRPTDLRVTITERIDLVLIGVAGGIGPQTLTTSAEASYLPPLQIGSRNNAFGDEMECAPGNGSLNSNTTACQINDPNSQHSQYFYASMDGPAELKESGDPMVYCEEGPSEPTQLTPPGTDPQAPGTTTYNGYPTDHPQYTVGSSTSYTPITTRCGQTNSSGNIGNPTQQPSGYAGPKTTGTAHPGGYNYEITVSPTISDSSLWVYNPNYVPQDNPCNYTIPVVGVTPLPAPIPLDRFVDGSCVGSGFVNPGISNFYQGPTGEGIKNWNGINHDAPLFYYTTTFTLYAVDNQYNRLSDRQVGQWVYKPYDATSRDLLTYGCVSPQVYDPYWSGGNTPNTFYDPGDKAVASQCKTPSAAALICPNQWCVLAPDLNAAVSSTGLYRLVVEVTGLNAAPKNPDGSIPYSSTSVDGWGVHGYALKLCDQAASVLTSGPVGCGNGGTGLGAGQYKSLPPLAVFAWNNMNLTYAAALTTRAPNSQYPATQCSAGTTTPYTCLDMACIPTDYAGRTLTVRIYDPGDGIDTTGNNSGNMYVGVTAPPGSGGTVTYPAYAQAQNLIVTRDGKSVVQTMLGGYRPYNGLFLDATLQMPPNYTGDCITTGWWQMIYASDNGTQPTDQLHISFTLVGSPSHLVVPS